MRQLWPTSAGYWVEELSAFGSVLRADFRADSDVDLLVEFEPRATIGSLALAGPQRELSVLLGRRVDSSRSWA